MSLLKRSPAEILERIAPLLVRPLAEVERRTIESAMILCQGNVAKAARRLQISRTTLASKVQKLRKEDA